MVSSIGCTGSVYGHGWKYCIEAIRCFMDYSVHGIGVSVSGILHCTKGSPVQMG